MPRFSPSRLLLFLAFLGPVAPPAYALNIPSAPPDITTILATATAQMRRLAIYSRAEPLYAVGTTASGNSTISPRDIVRWHLVFDNRYSPARQVAGFSLDYVFPTGFTHLADTGEPPLGLAILVPLPQMTLAHAVSFLHEHAHGALPFRSVTLHFVVGFHDNPGYEFDLGALSLVVDTANGRVTNPAVLP